MPGGGKILTVRQSLLAATLLASAALAPVAGAHGFSLSRPTPVSGLRGPHGDCPGAVSGRTFPASGLEPTIAAARGRHPRLVTAWMQGAAKEARAGAARAGGRRWRRSTPPGLSRCSGGDTDGTGDVSLAAGGRHRFYLASLPFNRVRPTFTTNSRLAVSTTRNGRAWSAPAIVVPPGSFVDHALVSADRRRGRTAYLVWTVRDNPPEQSGALYFARTDDGGRSWSAPVLVYRPLAELLLAGNGVAYAEPDGSLVVVFDLLNESSETGGVFDYPFQALAVRSIDGGASWSAPVRIATFPSYGSRFFFDSADGYSMQVNAWPSSHAEAPDGTVYAAWAAVESAHRTRVLVSASRDGGLRWSAPRPIDKVPGEAFQPTLAVDGRGVVAAFWYDLRGDRPGDGRTPTRVLFAISRDGGGHWSRPRSAAAFDYTRAVNLPGLEGVTSSAYFLGDYYGFAGLRSDFVAAFAMPSPHARRDRGPVRIYSTRLRP